MIVLLLRKHFYSICSSNQVKEHVGKQLKNENIKNYKFFIKFETISAVV